MASRAEYEKAVTCLKERSKAYGNVTLDQIGLSELPAEGGSVPVLLACTSDSKEALELAHTIQQQGAADAVEGAGLSFQGGAATEHTDDNTAASSAARETVETPTQSIAPHCATLIGGTELEDQGMHWLKIGNALEELTKR